MPARARIELGDGQRVLRAGDLDVEAAGEIRAGHIDIEAVAADLAARRTGVVRDGFRPGTGDAVVIAGDVGACLEAVIGAGAGNALRNLRPGGVIADPAGNTLLSAADRLHLAAAAP